MNLADVSTSLKSFKKRNGRIRINETHLFDFGLHFQILCVDFVELLFEHIDEHVHVLFGCWLTKRSFPFSAERTQLWEFLCPGSSAFTLSLSWVINNVLDVFKIALVFKLLFFSTRILRFQKKDFINLFKRDQNQTNICFIKVSKNDDCNSICCSNFNFQSRTNLPHFGLLSWDFETWLFGLDHGLSSGVEPWTGHWLSFSQTGIFLGVGAERARVRVLLAVVSRFGFLLLRVESALLALDFEGPWRLFGTWHAFGQGCFFL